MKHYKIKNFKETLKKIHFPDYLKYSCINSDFINKFLRAIDSVAPTKKLRVKAN